MCKFDQILLTEYPEKSIEYQNDLLRTAYSIWPLRARAYVKKPNGYSFFFLILKKFWPCLWHMEVPQARVQTKTIAVTRATAVMMPDL